MRKPLVAGNWKMNGSRELAKQITSVVKEQGHALAAKTDIALFPPYLYIEEVAKILADSNIAWGAQNVAAEKNGAFTGEISAEMLADYKCQYVIIGHSERRSYYGDTNQVVAKKLLMALDFGVNPIVCVGEQLDERKNNLTQRVVEEQLTAILNLDLSVEQFAKIIIAYEPVWAIGTGVTATPEQAQEVHAMIRSMIKKQYASIANETRIIYGGSVKASNATELFAMPDIDGGLVGGASLNAQEFMDICRCNN
jgi:triosephosphate isomerase